jgi:tetratricopeptide (TPR) repeat protein
MNFLLVFAAVVLAGPALSAPRVPAADSAVLERLPGRPADPANAELRSLRTALAATPRDPALAASVAEALFRRASAEGDPRYVGYAEAALAPWKAGDAPAEILYARGLLRQYRHDFAGALGDLQLVLDRDPGHEGARAWRAAILMVRADYAGAARECAGLPEGLHALACVAYVDASTGKTRSAYERLLPAVRAEADPGERLWALTRLAEMAWRLGDHAAAERHFRDALALGLEDNFLLAAYADFLLERARPAEVVALLRERSRSDTLLLRLAIAAQAVRAGDAEVHARILGERFAASALRGERLHLAEESRYLLVLKGDAKGALAAALENWRDQREPRDALAVLEAAVAAGDAKAAAPVLRWLRDSGFESERMRRLAAALK